MFDPKSDMIGKKIQQKKGTSASQMICGPAIALLLFCCAQPTLANPSSDYAGSTSTATVGQPFPQVSNHAENASAMFMVGLVVGMVSGITLFFVHLRRREKRLERFRFDETMLDSWPAPATDAPSWQSPSSTTSPWDPESNDEMIEKSDPWERSVDWWKNPEDQ